MTGGSLEQLKRQMEELATSVNAFYEDTLDMQKGLVPAQTLADVEEVRALVNAALFLETVEAQNYKNRMLGIIDAWIAEYAKRQTKKN